VALHLHGIAVMVLPDTPPQLPGRLVVTRSLVPISQFYSSNPRTPHANKEEAKPLAVPIDTVSLDPKNSGES